MSYFRMCLSIALTLGLGMSVIGCAVEGDDMDTSDESAVDEDGFDTDVACDVSPDGLGCEIAPQSEGKDEDEQPEEMASQCPQPGVIDDVNCD